MRALHERTDGLPPYLAHVLNDLLARGEPRNGDASPATQLRRIGIPENLAGIIEHYVARLSSDERTVLDAATVYGADFRADTIAAVLDRDAAAVATVCGHLARGRLWLRAFANDGSAQEPWFSFRHAVLRQWLYERIGPTQRTELQCKVAAALERQPTAGAAATVAAPPCISSAAVSL